MFGSLIIFNQEDTGNAIVNPCNISKNIAKQMLEFISENLYDDEYAFMEEFEVDTEMPSFLMLCVDDMGKLFAYPNNITIDASEQILDQALSAINQIDFEDSGGYVDQQTFVFSMGLDSSDDN